LKNEEWGGERGRKWRGNSERYLFCLFEGYQAVPTHLSCKDKLDIGKALGNEEGKAVGSGFIMSLKREDSSTVVSSFAHIIGTTAVRHHYRFQHT
jgi:hypothetical protein